MEFLQNQKESHHWQTNRRKLEEKKLTREQELESENELLRAELAFIKKLQVFGEATHCASPNI